MRTFGLRVNERLDELGMTKEEFRRETGIAPSTVNSWTSGERGPTGYNVKACAEALHVSSDWLLGLSREKGAA